MTHRHAPAPPRLTLRVGVTGHRTLHSDELVRKHAHDVLLHIHQMSHEVLHRFPVGYAAEIPLLRIVSPLAEGADRIVVEEALKLGYALQAPLPFERTEYEHDFSGDVSREQFRALLARADAVLELDGRRTAAPAAYANVGRTVLRQCDILVAVWNGEGAEGHGGTAEVVAEALASGLSVIWIHAHSGAVVLRTSTPDGVIDEALPALVRHVMPLLAAPSTAIDVELARAYDTIDLSHASDAAAAGRSVPDALASEYARADALANHFSRRYRRSFVANYIMSALAVLFALLGFLYPVATVVEALLIITILVLTQTGRRRHWHERWLNYRLLAEQLRQLAMVLPLGRTAPSFRVPAHAGENVLDRQWVMWRYRARTRELGLSPGCLDAAFLEAYRARLIRSIEEQRAFHDRASHRNHATEHRLHLAGACLFGFALLVCVMHLALHPPFAAGHGASSGGLDWRNLTLTGLSALLPAVGAAVAGILSQGEFGRLAQRSHAMARRLGDSLRRVNATDSLSSDVLGRFAEEASEVMTGELLDWQITFRSKPLNLPA